MAAVMMVMVPVPLLVVMFPDGRLGGVAVAVAAAGGLPVCRQHAVAEGGAALQDQAQVAPVAKVVDDMLAVDVALVVSSCKSGAWVHQRVCVGHT